MDKRKRNPQEGKGARKPHGRHWGSRNNRGHSGAPRVGSRSIAPAPIERKITRDPVAELLDLLRINPSTDGIKNIVTCTEEDGCEWYNLGKAVRKVMNRPLTNEEEILVKKLGDNSQS